MRIEKILVLLLLGACAHSSKTPEPQSQVISAWSELTSDNQLQIRAVIRGIQCPSALVDGGNVAMIARAQPTPGFSDLVCQAVPPTGATSASVMGTAVPVLSKEIKRVLVIGDTGCRLKELKDGRKIVQACNDPALWPFAKLAEAAARWKPDVVIHVGDYHYRETECPKNDSRCEKASAGDQMSSWNEDFLAPARPLLLAAPWVFVRGNHENCKRGGKGWNLLLDPRPFQATCLEQTAPFSVSLGDHQLTVIDASDDGAVQASLDQVEATPKHFHWLALHRPVLTPGADDEASHEVHFPKKLMTSGQRIGLVMTGHVHTLSVNRFADNRPPEVVSGNGGTSLEPEVDFDKMTGVIASQFRDFGFFTLERVARDRWRGVGHDRLGNAVMECQLDEDLKKKTRVDCHQSVGM